MRTMEQEEFFVEMDKSLARLKGKEKQELELLIYIIGGLRIIMATQTDVDAAIKVLDTDVKALIASIPVTTPPVDLQPQVDAINAVDAEVKAATPAPVVTPAPVT